ncbi:MAG: hypothetical protein KDA87_17300 [Planctomycetales bacterium]|nr:hypothetical protein [Planctomycetales bacterium]
MLQIRIHLIWITLVSLAGICLAPTSASAQLELDLPDYAADLEDDLSDGLSSELLDDNLVDADEDTEPLPSGNPQLDPGDSGFSEPDPLDNVDDERLLSDPPPSNRVLNDAPSLDSSMQDEVTEQLPDTNAVAEVETIKQNYPSGRLHIQRQVTQDEHQNYINHGTWKEFDEQGNVLIEGEYRFGQRVGKWIRWYDDPGQVKFLTYAPFNQSTRPFKSEAEFVDDKLDGTWTIMDEDGRVFAEWSFAAGRRHGKSTWWYANNQSMREITYRDGVLDGTLKEWDANGTPVTEVEYKDGRRLEKTQESYSSGQTRYEGWTLRARLVLKEPDDWEQGTLAQYTREGKDQRHGDWVAWFDNGQKKLAGSYEFDQPHGKFTWWHENGQKSLDAEYQVGKKSGLWTWWHKNGMKSIQGEYIADAPAGQWIWWKEDGKVAQRIDFRMPGQLTPPPANTVIGPYLTRPAN